MLIYLLGANQMFLEFVIGIAVYFLNRFVYLKEFLSKVIAVFSMLIFLLLFSVDYTSEFRVLIYGIPCALMLLACANINLARNNRLVVLGEISYSLYLSQSLLLFWFVKGSVLITNQLLQFLCMFLLIPISCVLIAFFIHKFIEIPLTNYAKNYLSRWLFLRRKNRLDRILTLKKRSAILAKVKFICDRKIKAIER